MYKDINSLGIQVTVIEEDDVCYSCQNKYDCPFVCGLNSGLIEFADKEDDNIIEDCPMFLKE